MNIKVLGSGCTNCKKTFNNVEKALELLKMEASIQKVEDFKDIMAYGVMRTPAIVIDEKVVSFGRVNTPEEIVTLIQKHVKSE